MKRRILAAIFAFLFVIVSSFSVFADVEKKTEKPGEQNSLSNTEINKIESIIKKNMKDGKIPGLSVVIVKGDKTVYNKGFGYADINAKKPVTDETLFELGSNSKAFTALGILKLKEEGKLKLSDPVKKYLPWFEMKYTGEYRGVKIDGNVDITLEQLLHHTSGIPFESIGDIPVAEGADALEKTVRTQAGKKLDFYPGEKFLYATINYDILGLVIQNISGESFEQYIKTNVLQSLGLNNTYLMRNEIPMHSMASGYKIQFLKPVEYTPPIYRGNTPAGYFITNANDLSSWIKIQMGTQSLEKFDKSLIDISHLPDRTVPPGVDGSSYAYGWSVFQDGGGTLAHGGSNPTYSSSILFRPMEKMGIGVLANLNSAYTGAIANEINKILRGEKPKSNTIDSYISIDNVSFTIAIISVPLALVTVYLLIVLLIQILKKERKYCGNVKKIIANIFFFLIFIAGLAYCMYRIPDVLYWGLPWSFIKIWAPHSLLTSVILLLSTVALFCLYFMLGTIFKKSNDKSLFVIAALSIISGFGNAIIIFIINETLNRDGEFQSGLLLFFVMGIVIYVYGQRLVRTKLLTLTNDLVYSKRVHLINRILKASYEKIEQMENGKIHAALNNDTETISNFANILITAVTSCITLICCFVYLGIIHLYGLLISILVIFIAAGLYFVVGRYANKLWEQTRDIQNIFFKFINSIINGFKELKMHNGRQREFKDEMLSSCEEYRDKRIKGDLGFANVFVIGELLFTLVIGAVAFVFPVVFTDIQTSSLRNYVFVFLYMTGPVHGVLNSIPQIINVKISYKRLEGLAKELESAEKEEDLENLQELEESQVELALNKVEYSYKKTDGEIFKVGPVSYGFKSGEITFITGGNGSGKSTLAKLLTGLYAPDSGEITVNGSKLSLEELRQNYSTIFSDYYLFDKLYGIDHENKSEIISELLKVLRIDDKLSINNGEFSTTRLSSGQRKRLAFLVSYLEDRPIVLFDEWAADQDPEFRRFFYEHLLIELKARGKCVIAITHDDRYFNRADKVLKMEAGNINCLDSAGSS